MYNFLVIKLKLFINYNNIYNEMNNLTFIFDIETTGLFIRERNKKVDFKNLNNFDNCRIVSISWIIIETDNTDNIIEKKNYYIKPDNFNVPQESINIHGLTNEFLLLNGISVHNVFEKLIDIFSTNTKNYIIHIVSHNINFDINVLKSELYRYNYFNLLNIVENTNIFCTMLESHKIMNMGKWPKLKEAYMYFYNKDIENAHQSEFDTLYCYQIYKKLISKN